MENTLISPDATWALWAVLLGAAAVGFWSERTRLGSAVSGAVITILTTFVLSNLRIIPAKSAVYDTVWDYFVPLAIPLLLFRADLKRIIRESGPTLVAFLIGAAGTIIGTWVAYPVVAAQAEGWKLAGIFCATYIGGSMNYMAVAETLHLRAGDLLAAGVAADNLAMTFYFLILFALPASVRLRKWYPERSVQRAVNDDEPVLAMGTDRVETSMLRLALAVTLAAGVCAAGFGLANVLGWRGGGILILTAIIVGLASLFPRRLGAMHEGGLIGMFLMQIFFAAIGASASIRLVITSGPRLFLFALVILAVHLLVILLVGRLFRLDLREIVIASNANMGGPTTAAAMATARHWGDLVIPAILCGTFGYATATFVGTLVAYWLH